MHRWICRVRVSFWVQRFWSVERKRSKFAYLAAIQQPYLHFQNTVLYPSERLAVQSGLDIVVTLNRYSGLIHNKHGQINLLVKKNTL